MARVGGGPRGKVVVVLDESWQSTMSFGKRNGELPEHEILVTHTKDHPLSHLNVKTYLFKTD
jgi:hypothetical protein